MTTSFHESQDATLRQGLEQIIGAEVLKTAMDQCANMSDTPANSLFADRIMLEHPLFTPETAVASFAFTKLAGVSLKPAVQVRLEDAVKLSAYAELVPMLNAAILPEDVVKIASGPDDDSNWALSTEAGVTYPLHDYASTIQSAKRIAADYIGYKLPASMVKSASAKVMAAVARHDVETFMLPELVMKHAHERLPDVASAASRIAARVKGMTPDTAQSAIEMYSEVFKNASNDDADAIVALVHEIDRSFNIKYSTMQPDPISLVYDAVPLEARIKQANAVVLLCDAQIPSEVFSGIVDRLPIGAFFDDTKAATIKVAGRLAADGNGAEASVVLQDLTEAEQHVLGGLILKVA